MNGYNCKVFSATNVELVTKTRLEHLSDSDKEKAKVPKSSLQSFLGIAETEQQSSTSSDQENVCFFFFYFFLFFNKLLTI